MGLTLSVGTDRERLGNLKELAWQILGSRWAALFLPVRSLPGQSYPVSDRVKVDDTYHLYTADNEPLATQVGASVIARVWTEALRRAEQPSRSGRPRGTFEGEADIHGSPLRATSGNPGEASADALLTERLASIRRKEKREVFNAQDVVAWVDQAHAGRSKNKVTSREHRLFPWPHWRCWSATKGGPAEPVPVNPDALIGFLTDLLDLDFGAGAIERDDTMPDSDDANPASATARMAALLDGTIAPGKGPDRSILSHPWEEFERAVAHLGKALEGAGCLNIERKEDQKRRASLERALASYFDVFAPLEPRKLERRRDNEAVRREVVDAVRSWKLVPGDDQQLVLAGWICVALGVEDARTIEPGEIKAIAFPSDYDRRMSWRMGKEQWRHSRR